MRRDELRPAAGRRVLLSPEEMPAHPGCSCKVLGNDMAEAVGLAWDAVHPSRSGKSPADRPEDSAVLDTGGADRLLMTEDFGPIVCNDLEVAGRVAALHALSDIYACLGTPRWARVLFVAKTGSTVEQMHSLLAGIFRSCAEEGVEVAGGHSILGDEWMAGLAVVGGIGPRGPLSKRGARAGDHLLLSKPLGGGTILRAHRLGMVGDAELEEALAVMTASNRPAAELAEGACVRAGTDVTGFGALGSLAEMLTGGLGAAISLSLVPVLPAAQRLNRRLGSSRWLDGNWEYVRELRRVGGICDPELLLPLLAPETNGGLLVAASPSEAAGLAAGGGFQVIGQVTGGGKINVQS